MARQSLTLWQKRAEARITLTRALDLFDTAYRATNHSLRTVRWYRLHAKRRDVHVDFTVANGRKVRSPNSSTGALKSLV